LRFSADSEADDFQSGLSCHMHPSSPEHRPRHYSYPGWRERVVDITMEPRSGPYSASQGKSAIVPDEFDSLYYFSVARQPLVSLALAYQYAQHDGESDCGVRHDRAHVSDHFRLFGALVH